MEPPAILDFDLGSYRTSVLFSPRLPAGEQGRIFSDLPALGVFDTNTARLLPLFQENRVVIPAGEKGKDWASVERILEQALEGRLDRGSLFVGIGGGVVCDVTAFAASLYMRGARLHLVPTTLLAMVDAAFGGKTAINFQGWKNMVGTFYPAERVYIFPEVLRSLPERELRSGLAEVIKSAMLRDADLFRVLERTPDASPLSKLPLETYETWIRRSLLVKAWYVTRDLRENDERAHLNLGHTFAHGLESATHFSRYTHGDAVAWGLFRAMDAGVRLKVTDPSYAERVKNLLRRFGFPEKVTGITTEQLYLAIQQDKKKRGEVRFVLQESLGKTLITSLNPDLVKGVIQEGID